MNSSPLAEAFPAGEFLAEELEVRGWSQQDFASILGRPVQFVSEIITGKREITRESAAQIGAALGTSAELWLNLQDTYLLWRQSLNEDLQRNVRAVRTRAELQKLAPVRLLRKAGFVGDGDVEDQAREVLGLFGKTSLDDPFTYRFAARRSNVDEQVSTLQHAWVACVRSAAQLLPAADYDPEEFDKVARSLSGLSRDPDAFSAFQALCAAAGVKLVYLEAFPGGRLDGCAMTVDGSPVIGVSGRGQRLDKVLFTLLHEAAHVLLGHLGDEDEIIIDDLECSGTARIETEADELASRLAIPGPLPEVPPRVTMPWVRRQAEVLGVHPLTLIGRLQKEGRIPWKTTLVRQAPTVTRQLGTWQTPRPELRGSA